MMGATCFEAEAFDLSGLGDGIDDPYWYVLVTFLVAKQCDRPDSPLPRYQRLIHAHMDSFIPQAG
jgi:hypothetical protein